MRTYLGVLAVFIVTLLTLALMLVLATPMLGFGLMAELAIVAVVLVVAKGTSYVVFPRG